MGWNYLSIPKVQQCNRWSQGMDNWWHSTLYNGFHHLTMLGFKLIHVSKLDPWASYQIRKIANCACTGNAGNVFPDTDFKGNRVMHVPWCMSGSLTRGGGENVPGILGACATHDFTYLARGPWCIILSAFHFFRHKFSSVGCVPTWSGKRWVDSGCVVVRTVSLLFHRVVT